MDICYFSWPQGLKIFKNYKLQIAIHQYKNHVPYYILYDVTKHRWRKK